MERCHQCITCRKKFSTKANLKRHNTEVFCKAYSDALDDMTFMCHICDNTWIDKAKFNRHVKTCKVRIKKDRKANRNKVVNATCPLCFRVLKRSCDYKQHLHRHTIKDSKIPLMRAFDKIEVAMLFQHFRKDTNTIRDFAKSIAINHSMLINERIIGQILHIWPEAYITRWVVSDRLLQPVISLPSNQWGLVHSMSQRRKIFIERLEKATFPSLKLQQIPSVALPHKPDLDLKTQNTHSLYDPMANGKF